MQHATTRPVPHFRLLASLIALCVLLALPRGSAAAAAPADTTPPPPTTAGEPWGLVTEADASALENAYQRAVRVQTQLQERIDRAALDGARRAAHWTEWLAARGGDAAGLQPVLAAHAQALTDARARLAEIQALLDAPAGLDAAGVVTDLTAARETMRQVLTAQRELRFYLRDTHTALIQGLKDARQTVPGAGEDDGHGRSGKPEHEAGGKPEKDHGNKPEKGNGKSHP